MPVFSPINQLPEACLRFGGVLYPLAMVVTEGLLNVAAHPVARLPVGLVVVVLFRSLPYSAELLDFCTDILAFLVEPWDRARAWRGPWCQGFNAGF